MTSGRDGEVEEAQGSHPHILTGKHKHRERARSRLESTPSDVLPSKRLISS